MTKTRLAKDGTIIEAPKGKELKGDLERISSQKAEGYCASCAWSRREEELTLPLGSQVVPVTEELRQQKARTQAAATLVRKYARRTFVVDGASSTPTRSSRCAHYLPSLATGKLTLSLQCVSEGWTDKIKEQSEEGCNIAGKVRVNKVIGNFHLSPGRSFQANAMHVHDLVPYLQGGNKHDFGHVINHFSFSSETEEEFVGPGGRGLAETKRSLGIVNPLDGLRAHTEESN